MKKKVISIPEFEGRVFMLRLFVLFAIFGLAGCFHGQNDKHLSTDQRAADSNSATNASEKLSLRILYAGNPGTARCKHFLKFLGEHFREVQRADIAGFNPAHSDFDVVILDYRGASVAANVKESQLTVGYSRPTVIIGNIPSRISKASYT
jgi:hypothetical protein